MTREQKLEQALDSIRQYGRDTLSGRVDGPTDVTWLRDGVREMTKRAHSALSTPKVEAVPMEWPDIDEDDPDVMIVAKAIAENGIGRPWDDFLPVNAYDFDHGDLIEYGRAAVAAMRTTSPIPTITSEDIERAARALDPEIWEIDAPTPTRAATEDFHARRSKSIETARTVLTAAFRGETE